MDEPEPHAAEPDEGEGPVVGLTQLFADRRVVTRSIHLARLDDDDRRPVADPTLRGLVREPFRLVVVAQEPGRDVAPVRLVDHDALRVPEDVHRGDVDDPGDRSRDRGIEDPLGRTDVGIEHVRSLGPGDPDTVRAGEVHDAGGTRHRRDQRRGIREVARDRLDRGGKQGPCRNRIADERRHVVAASDQLIDDVTADEARRARDDDASRPGHAYWHSGVRR